MALAVGSIICLLGNVLCIRMNPFGFIFNSHSASEVSFHDSRRLPAPPATPDRTVCHCVDRSMFTVACFLLAGLARSKVLCSDKVHTGNRALWPAWYTELHVSMHRAGKILARDTGALVC